MKLFQKRTIKIIVRREGDGSKICTIKLSRKEFETVMITATAAGLSLEEFFSRALENSKNNAQ